MALYSLGEIREIEVRSAVWHREATEMGDIFGRITASLSLALARIAAGEVEDSRRLVREDMLSWSQRGVHVQHLYALRLEVYRDLYEGRPHAAHTRIADAWREIEASQQLRVQFSRIDLRQLRARAAIASAAARWSGRAPLLALAEQEASRLEREVRHDAPAAAALLRACVAAARGDREVALHRLEAAEAGYEAAGMVLLASCARRRRGALEGGDEGRLRIAEADAFMNDRGIAQPERWLDMYAPGFGR
jgi:hypothetical protein